MNLIAARLFQPAWVTMASIVIALIVLGLAIASALGTAAFGFVDVAPFRWQ